MHLCLPPILAYRLPPKYPFTGEVAAYTKMQVLNMEPRLQVRKKLVESYLDILQYNILVEHFWGHAFHSKPYCLIARLKTTILARYQLGSLP